MNGKKLKGGWQRFSAERGDVVGAKLRFPPKARERIEGIAEKTDQNLSEVFRGALALYDLVFEQFAAGKKILAREPDGTERELIVPEFNRALSGRGRT